MPLVINDWIGQHPQSGEMERIDLEWDDLKALVDARYALYLTINDGYTSRRGVVVVSKQDMDAVYGKYRTLRGVGSVNENGSGVLDSLQVGEHLYPVDHVYPYTETKTIAAYFTLGHRTNTAGKWRLFWVANGLFGRDHYWLLLNYAPDVPEGSEWDEEVTAEVVYLSATERIVTCVMSNDHTHVVVRA